MEPGQCNGCGNVAINLHAELGHFQACLFRQVDESLATRLRALELSMSNMISSKCGSGQTGTQIFDVDDLIKSQFDHTRSVIADGGMPEAAPPAPWSHVQPSSQVAEVELTGSKGDGQADSSTSRKPPLNPELEAAECGSEPRPPSGPSKNSINDAEESVTGRVSIEGLQLRASRLYGQMDAFQMQARGTVSVMVAETTLQAWVFSPYFEYSFGILVVINALFLGLEVETFAHAPDRRPSSVFMITSMLFCFIFLLELLLRIRAYGFKSYCSPTQSAWMWFDTAMVLLSLVESGYDCFVLLASTDDDNAPILTNLRALRVIKIAKTLRSFRLVRMLRFNFLNSLHAFVLTIRSSLRLAAWSGVLLLVIIYCFSLFFVQAAASHVAGSDATSSDAALLHQYWGRLSAAQVTLFQAVSGGLSWNDAMLPLTVINPYLTYFLITYVSITYFCVLNGVTGAFCNSAIEAALASPEIMAQTIMERNSTYERRLREIFAVIDTDKSGVLSVAEFDQIMQQPFLEAILIAMELDTHDTWTLFWILDKNGDGTISTEEFIKGCVRMKGPAKSLDVVHLLAEIAEVKKMSVKLSELVDR
eukprot:gb/GFBE01039657.1/.p1 GENE.gb/GFBE01039657.1/~~gb/GFBE01039657.1/.p1  ORF type:complete len:590 (+),score=98.22 gb/GFBE01039657.1/:1-1770(+)